MNEENETQTTNENWIKEEQQEVEQTGFNGVKLEALKLEENKAETIAVDISEPWGRWQDPNGTIKKIIPVTHEGTEKNFWLNTRNPLYRELLDLAADAAERKERSFIVKILRTGQKENTRYIIPK
jgi:hypothetical protein